MKTKLRPIAIAAFLILLMGAGCASPSKPAAIAPAPPEDPTTLDLSSHGLKAVPADVFGRTDLVELDLADNDLTGALPSQIGQLKKLRILDASHNQLTGVPAEIGQLADLEALDLSDNKITGLPLEIGNLKNLKILNLTDDTPNKKDLDAIKARLPDLTIITK